MRIRPSGSVGNASRNGQATVTRPEGKTDGLVVDNRDRDCVSFIVNQPVRTTVAECLEALSIVLRDPRNSLAASRETGHAILNGRPAHID